MYQTPSASSGYYSRVRSPTASPSPVLRRRQRSATDYDLTLQSAPSPVLRRSGYDSALRSSAAPAYVKGIRTPSPSPSAYVKGIRTPSPSPTGQAYVKGIRTPPPSPSAYVKTPSTPAARLMNARRRRTPIYRPRELPMKRSDSGYQEIQSPLQRTRYLSPVQVSRRTYSDDLGSSGASLPRGNNVWQQLVERSVNWELSPDFWLKYPPQVLLGKGAFGEVWEVRDRLGGPSYAVKLLEQKPNDDTEIQSLLQLWKQCPKFPRLHGAYIVPDPLDSEKPRYALLMDFVPGQNGKQAVLDREQLLEASKQLLEQLACLHKIGVAHRDIKPDNVLIDSSNGDVQARLVDLGLACRLLDTTLQELPICSKVMVYGDRYYLAPELGAAGARQNAASDIWAMGVTLYYLAHPKPINDLLSRPWGNLQENTNRLFKEIQKPSRDEFDKLLQKMTAANPSLRPTAEQALQTLKTIV